VFLSYKKTPSLNYSGHDVVFSNDGHVKLLDRTVFSIHGHKCLFSWCKSLGVLHGFPRDAARARLAVGDWFAINYRHIETVCV